MLLRWSCVLLIYYLIVDLNRIDCVTQYNSNRGSSGSSRPSSFGSSRPSSSFGGSRPSSSFGSSRPSSSFGASRPSSSFGASRPSSSFGSSRPSTFGSNSGSHGSYGWTTRHTTQRPYTQRYSTRHYPVTTMPTRRSTTRRHVMTTMPTHRSTTRRPIITTMPTHRSTHFMTRQPAVNPFFTTPRRQNHSGSILSSTKQPAYNPFFSSSVRPNNNAVNNPNRQNMSHGAITRQPAYNPFFSSTTQRPNNPFQNTPSRNNGSNIYHNTPSTFFSTKATIRPATFQNNSRPINNYNNSSPNFTPRPNVFQTTKVAPVGNGNNGGKWDNSRPVTPVPNTNWRPSSTWTSPRNQSNTFTRPSWNSSSIHGTSGTHQPIYRPPGAIDNTFSSRPNYVTGSQNTYHPHATHPTNTGTTIVNNNNYHYHPGGGYYHPSTGQTSHVTVINNNNYYNPNHHVIIPSTHYYGYGPPAVGISIVNSNYYSHPISPHYVNTYHYSSGDTGSTALGFFLGYQLGKITRPSYYYHSTTYYNNEYVPRYDHYTVHHYYHNNQNIPKESPIQPNAVVVCPGDSTSLCPPGNMPLCTNNGAVMCVVNAQSTMPCTGNIQTNCVKSTISCEGNTSPECKQQTQTTISVPCISTAKINAGVEFVNNSLIVTNPTDDSTKAFCVTILALPSQSKEASQNNPAQKNTLPPIIKQEPFRYTTNETGVGVLGYYLGNRLQDLAEPSYSFLNYDENYNYIENFDHYNVYHYDHDATILPETVEIKAEQVMKCAGDSGTFCPQNSTSLCLFDGAVICVSESAIYSQELQTNFIYSNISCAKLTSPACLSTPNETISLQIPCISKAKLYARTSYLIKSYGSSSNLTYYRTLEPVLNGTVPETMETPRELCVVVLALPGEKVIRKVPENSRLVSGVPNNSNSFKLPKYAYDIKETGNNIFGRDLANRLGKISFPTYYWINAFLYRSSGEVQKYDHYSLHYYEHGNEILPSDLVLNATEIKGCDGDSGVICPQKTISICLNDGSVWCIQDLMLTKTCTKYNNTLCASGEVSCDDNPSLQCKKRHGTKKIEIACEATLTIFGDTIASDQSIYKVVDNFSQKAQHYTELQQTSNSNNTSKAQHFCVGLVSIPAERKISEGEKAFENTDSLFGKLASKIFGI